MKATTETHYANILTTALEGGLGYVDMSRKNYRWFDPELSGGTAEPAPNGGGNVTCTLLDWNELTDDGQPTEYSVTLATVSKAATALTKLKNEGSQHSGHAALLAIIRDQDSDYDWIDAFNILQFGTFGEAIYG